MWAYVPRPFTRHRSERTCRCRYGVRLVCCSQRLRCWSASASFTAPTSPRGDGRRGDEVSGRPDGRTASAGGVSLRRPDGCHWHFIPTEMFPRNGLTIGAMTEPQRKLAHALLRAGLSQRGYLTATAIMDLETILGALEAAPAPASPGAGRPDGPRPGALLLLRVRHAVDARRVGLARGRSPHLAELHRRQRHPRRRVAVVLRHQPGRGPRRSEEGLPDSRRRRRLGARAARWRSTRPSARRRSSTPTAPNDISTMNALKIDPLSPAGIGAAS